MKKSLFIIAWFILLVGLTYGQTYLIQQGFSTTSLPSGWSGDVYFNTTANIGNLTGANGAGFNESNKYLQLPALSNVGTLTFWMKGSASSSQISMKVQKSVGGGSFSDIATFPKPHTTTAIKYTVLVNDSNTNVVLKFVAYDRTGNSLYLDDIEITEQSASPTITLTPSVLTNFSYVYGTGPSSEDTFSLVGSGLTGNVTVSTNSNYEISSVSGGTFGSNLSFTPSSGNVSSTVYVRLKSGLSIGDYSNEIITASSSGATDKTVTCSGSVTIPLAPASPTANAGTSVTSSGFTANWEVSERATSYELDVYSGTYTELVYTSFEGSTSFPTGWIQNSSYVQNNSIGAHTGTNYAGMNAAGDYFYTPILSSPTTVSFWVVASSATANNTLIVQFSSDATSWTDLATYSANGVDTGEVTTTFSQKIINANLVGDYYIRWYMSARSGGSQYYDDILISNGSKTYYVNDLNVGNVTSYNVTGLDPETTYYYVVRAYDVYDQTSSNSNEIAVTTSAAPANVVINADGTATGAAIVSGGSIPESLLGADSGAPAIVYTITSTGVKDVTVYKTAAFAGDWYCWLNTPGGLIAGANPIQAANFYIFEDVNFDAKGDVVVIINDNSTLPVELSSFTATLSAQNLVSLMWITQSETGVSGYYIYRGIDTNASTAQIVSPLITATNTSTTQSYVYVDSEIFETGTYYYWLQNVDIDGTTDFHGPIRLDYVAGQNNGTPNIPVVTELKNVYPNPFNPIAFISYSLAENNPVAIKIYNNRGQLVRVLDNAPATAGNHRIEWNGMDNSGIACSTGLYLVRMTAGNKTFTQKVVLVK